MKGSSMIASRNDLGFFYVSNFLWNHIPYANGSGIK